MNPEEINTTLARLGSTPSAIAAALSEDGITGVPLDDTACPIFHFLTEAGVPVRSVDNIGITLADERWIETPAVVAEFIDEFDDGGYPELVEP